MLEQLGTRVRPVVRVEELSVGPYGKIASTASTVVAQRITWTRILRARPMGGFSRLASWAVGATFPAGAPVEDSAMIYSRPIRPPGMD